MTHCLHHGLPPSLRVGKMVLIPKTPRPSPDPALYRPITLLPTLTRLLFKVLDTKIRTHLTDSGFQFPIEQGGFLPRRNTHLQGFLLLLLRDYARHRHQNLFVAFLDVRKAFDTIHHVQLLKVLRSLHLPEPFINAIHRLLVDFKVDILGEWVKIEKGVFQGSPLFPLLCILFLLDLVAFLNGDEASAFHGTEFPWSSPLVQTVIRLLCFADDIALLASSLEQLQLALQIIQE